MPENNGGISFGPLSSSPSNGGISFGGGASSPNTSNGGGISFGNASTSSPTPGLNPQNNLPNVPPPPQSAPPAQNSPSNISFTVPPQNSAPSSIPNNSPFNDEFKAMMHEMGVHPIQQKDIMDHPEQHLDEIQQVRERIKKKKEAEEKEKLKKESETNEEGGKIVKVKSIGDQVHMEDILDAICEHKASDLHLAANARVAMRINGAIHFIENIPQLSKEQGERIILSMVPNKTMQETLFRTKELDLSYEHSNGTFFRVNIFYKRGNMATVMRRIASEALAMEKLGMPESVLKALRSKQGLILVTGPTGSGKSTSMQSMLNYINETRVEHIVTIEDPIEFVFSNQKSVFSQREVGNDTLSFANALKGALRQDPDVVMIGEMRDPETISAAMNLSETGHLVFSTLHTSGAPQTVSRVVNAFPPDQHAQIQSRLADSLVAVLSQRLIPKADKSGRIAIYEFMMVNSAIKNIIRTGDVAQMENAILAGRKEGMVLMKNSAEQRKDEGLILEKDYMGFFMDDM
ncbi:MAG: PilT/PilU family type 4a pilus ATPase [Candidatus Peregrinibacteria bacterium]